MNGFSLDASLSNRYFVDKPFADIHKVAGLRGVYIASQLPNSSYTSEQQVSLISFNKGGSWQRLTAPTVDSEGVTTNCTNEFPWFSENYWVRFLLLICSREYVVHGSKIHVESG